ncbi:hypothetical protein AL051_04055 [Pseudomonas amygdali pv. dendropanacis]|nr:hypothetical protein AL051_04055 [Pseudomonas amygdali pv. dendropanacis]
MSRSDYGWASGFRHGAMLCRQRTNSLLDFVYTLLVVYILHGCVGIFLLRMSQYMMLFGLLEAVLVGIESFYVY